MDVRRIIRQFAAELLESRDTPLVPVTADSRICPGKPIHRHDYHELRFILPPGSEAPEKIEVIYPGICHHALSFKECEDAHVLALVPERQSFNHRLFADGGFNSEYAPLAIRALDRLREAPAEADGPTECRMLLALLYLRAEIVDSDACHRDSRIEIFIRRISDLYYRHDLSIAREAANVGYSPNYVQKVFRAAVGESPKEYLIRIRMEAAARFLRERRYSVGEVASLCGFSGKQYFSGAFRRHYGCAPSDFASAPPAPFLRQKKEVSKQKTGASNLE